MLSTRTTKKPFGVIYSTLAEVNNSRIPRQISNPCIAFHTPVDCSYDCIKMTFLGLPNRHAVNTTNGSLLRIRLLNIIFSLRRKVVFRIFGEVAPPGSPNPDPVKAKGRHFLRTQFHTKSLFLKTTEYISLRKHYLKYTMFNTCNSIFNDLER